MKRWAENPAAHEVKPCQAALLHFSAFQGARAPREANRPSQGEAKAHVARDRAQASWGDTTGGPSSHAYEELPKLSLGDRLPLLGWGGGLSPREAPP